MEKLSKAWQLIEEAAAIRTHTHDSREADTGGKGEVRAEPHEHPAPGAIIHVEVVLDGPALGHYVLVLTDLVFAIATVGIDLITILAGALGVGVGIGLQNAVANFVSG